MVNIMSINIKDTDLPNDPIYDNISSIVKVLESTLYDKIRQKNEIIFKLLEENKNLKDQLNKTSGKQKKNIKNKVNKNDEILPELNTETDSSETIINISTKPARIGQLKEANDFFKKEYQNYLNKLNKQ